MKCIFFFVAVIAIVSANTVGRAGWGNQGSGWGANFPQTSINLAAALAAAGQGNAAGSQQLLQLASGDATNPAVIISSSGVNTQVDQGGNVQQVALANSNDGTSSTINDASIEQSAVAVDALEASVAGANLAQVENSASTIADGSGDIAEAAITVNELQNGESSGWAPV